MPNKNFKTLLNRLMKKKHGQWLVDHDIERSCMCSGFKDRCKLYKLITREDLCHYYQESAKIDLLADVFSVWRYNANIHTKIHIQCNRQLRSLLCSVHLYNQIISQWLKSGLRTSHHHMPQELVTAIINNPNYHDPGPWSQ